MRTKLRSKFTLLFIVCAALLAVGGTAMAITTDTSGSTSPAPAIQSDKDDYAPGELVTLTGSGWQAGESVNIKVNDDAGQTWSRNVNVIADESGSISDSFNLPDWFVAAYSVTATGSSGTATTSFTDARVVTTATLNGGNSVNVTPGGSITANVTVERSGSGANARWESTGWSIGTTEPGSFNCVDHTDYTTNAPTPVTNSESFTITAPNTNGTYNAYFKAYNDDSCSTASGANAPSATFTISNGVVVKTNQATLNYTGPTSGAFGDKLTLSSSGGSGTGAVTYEVTGTACELGTGADAGKLLITSGTGTCSVTVKKAGDSNFNAASSAPQSITVNKAEQDTLTLNAPSDMTFGQAAETLTTTGGSGDGAVSYSVGTSNGCAVSGDQLTVTNASGNCSVTATKAGNNNYESTTSAAKSVTLHKAEQDTLTLNAPSDMTFGQAAETLTTTGGSGDGAVSYSVGTSNGCAVSGDQLTVTNASGNCSVTATKAGNDNYLPKTSAPQSVTLNKASQTITFGPLANKIVGAPDFQVSAMGGASGNPVTFTATGSCTIISGNTVHITGVGSCTITASQAGNDNYLPAPNVSQSFNASYTFFGWLQPVDGDGTATGTVNMGKVGRTYPIKWQLKDATGALISDAAAQALVSSMSGVAKKANCSTFVGSDALEEYTAGSTVLRYDATSDQFIYNYKAPSSPACQAFVVSKADGVNDKQANFNFTK